MVRMGPRPRDIADQVRTILGVVGVYLIVFGLAALVWSVRASFGYHDYAKLVLKPADPSTQLALARKAFRGYPRNYSVCIRAAQTAFKAAEAASTPEEAEALISQARHWVSLGMELNPHLIELHYLNALLLARDGKLTEAATAWEAYVDWHFWDPGNLEHLARFQEEAGETAKALETLRFLKGPKINEWRTRLEKKAGGEKERATLPVESGAGRP